MKTKEWKKRNRKKKKLLAGEEVFTQRSFLTQSCLLHITMSEKKKGLFLWLLTSFSLKQRKRLHACGQHSAASLLISKRFLAIRAGIKGRQRILAELPLHHY